VEIGEQCDDTTTCCVGCKFRRQCTAAKGNACCDGSTCKYKASTVKCNNGGGYCANGACRTSICGGYGLVFCGMVNSGCKQSCKQPGRTCSTAWSRPNVNVASGVVCKTPDIYKCNGKGSCVNVAGLSTYVWTEDGMSDCSCRGTQQAMSKCVDEDGTLVDDSLCDAASKPALEFSCAAPSSCYAWQTGNWTTCNVNCGTSKQSRTVQVRQTHAHACVRARGRGERRHV
jgi:hypothetical protein